MALQNYLEQLNQYYVAGIATEHTYRPALQSLLEAMLSGIKVTNEPKQIDCGAPDFVLTRNAIPLGYIEAKDLDKDLDDRAHAEQLRRYTESLGNLIFTNYLEFRFFRDGKVDTTVCIAELSSGRVKPKPDQFATFTDLLHAFDKYDGTTIKSANNLAHHMAAKARLLARVIAQALFRDTHPDDEISASDSALQNQLAVFKKHLIHDIDRVKFADIYAQTVAYGMFAARLHDTTMTPFTRSKAAELIPATNPFLRRFFQHIAGYELDERIRWAVDDLADLFRAADLGELMQDYGKATQRNDPFLHFYETFLGEYNPKLRKSRGVYYTPEPVVNFIVRAVDDILQTEFGIKDGLADTGKTVIEVDAVPSAKKGKKGKIEKDEKKVHKVQILDPATGTGTFLAAIVQQIYEKKFANQKGAWQGYVRDHLIPRLNGFEVLMASYAMAHTKLEMVLRDSGCELGEARLRIYLTNSLEEYHPDTGKLFAQWLADEANDANFIKRDTPVMVVLGNPPYSGESANKGKWITDLLKKYKQEPGGGKLEEKNSKWINDDYVKFIRYGQHYIDRTGEGILAYISNHSFLDNPTFRGMRWSLLHSFDKIYILDLHGNSMQRETAPDGTPDKNVFDIRQGVSINIFIKTAKKKDGALAKVFHRDLYGERDRKYQFLGEHNLEESGFQELQPQAPQYFFVPKDYGLWGEYEKGFSVTDMFPTNSVGIVTARDSFTIHHRPHELKTAISRFRSMDDEIAREKFSLGADVRDWKVALARKDLEQNVFANNNDTAVSIDYRPFDTRYTYYTGNSKGFHCMPRGEVMQHFLSGDNIGLTLCRQFKASENYYHSFITKNIFESSLVSNKTSEIGYGFPLYLYTDTKQSDIDDDEQRKPNLDDSIVKTIAENLGLRFTPEAEDDPDTFIPIDLLDYLYAVLHSPTYRERYKEFLKIDFPRVPYPTEKKQFRRLVKLGGELRTLHLMESPTLDNLITGYNEPGEHVVGKPEYKITDSKNRLGEVRINKTQYFSDVPETAWHFYIGGYQPAQKWLKDRKGRSLSSDDIGHYQKIIVALTETDRLMAVIDTLWQPPPD